MRPVLLLPKAFREMCFNPRTREGCDNLPIFFCRFGYKFQSTHPRGVRLKSSINIIIDHPVSIHAPARGATAGQYLSGAQTIVSIHAPARGATRMAGHQSHDAGSFNPRTREGCDTAPLGGVPILGSSFNPRTREGCDVIFWRSIFRLRLFQSTHPRGVRPYLL